MKSEIKFFDVAMPALPEMPVNLHSLVGAFAEFHGRVRLMEKGNKISALRYEIYRPMAEKVLEAHINELGRKYKLLAVRFWHREGVVPVDGTSVYVAVTAQHRREAFAALGELLDRLKTDVPIWKAEALPEKSETPGCQKSPPDSAPELGSVAAVQKILSDRLVSIGDERVPLSEALSRQLRADVAADTDQPPFDRSAVDGYAFIPSSAGTKYRVVATVKAGETASRVPGPGECLRIFTGAVVPAPGLAVLMQEQAKVEGHFISTNHLLNPGENIRPRGSDAKAGTIVLAKGSRLSPPNLAILASVGEVNPLVKAFPRIAHATTGDEIVSPASTPGPAQIRNSNQVLVSSLLQQARLPARNLHHEHWGDDPAQSAVRLAAEPFAKAHIILISGGASVGEHDYTARLLESAGFELVVRKVNMRPGRPLIVAFRGQQVAFGLPGNPVSHYVCFGLFVSYAMQMLCRSHPGLSAHFHEFILDQPLTSASNPRPTYWPARTLQAGKQGRIEPLAWNNSGHLAALADANAIIFVPPNSPDLPAGSLVQVSIPWLSMLS